MIPLYSKCYVEKEGIGQVEAVCNDSPNGGMNLSYCVRLRKNKNSLAWFEADKVDVYNGPDEEEDKDKTENQGKTKKESKYKSKRA